MHRMWFAAAVAALAAGCPGDDPPACVTVDVDCAELYAPTFENVYTRTLATGCGSTALACHSAAGKKGGMSFEDMATAFTALRAGRVVPGDAACSEMIVRTTSVGEAYQMPPGSALTEPERCSLIKWVQSGALGPGGTQ
jgi:cytochrome c551/c552